MRKFEEVDGELHFLNETHKCSKWEFDTTYYDSTLVREVRWLYSVYNENIRRYSMYDIVSPAIASIEVCHVSEKSLTSKFLLHLFSISSSNWCAIGVGTCRRLRLRSWQVSWSGT